MYSILWYQRLLIALFCVLPVALLFFVNSLPQATSDPLRSTTRLFAWIEDIPTKPEFYILIGLIAAIHAVRMRISYHRLVDDFRQQETAAHAMNLSDRDWWALRSIRERALLLRQRADWTRFGAIGLLLSSLYALAFLVPLVQTTDFFSELNLSLSRRFGNQLESVRQGHYWLHSLQLGSEIPTVVFSTDGNGGVVGTTEGSVYMTVDGGNSWRLLDSPLSREERLAGAAVGPDGPRLVVGTLGTVSVSDDGMTWRSTLGLPLSPTEWVGAASMGPDGVRVLVGNRGSIMVSTDRTTWIDSSSELRLTGAVTVSEWTSDGNHGVIGDDSGSVFVTSDGARTWTPLEALPWRPDEWAVSASTRRNGVRAVVGNRGSVFVSRDGASRDEASWEEVSSELELSGRVTMSEWSSGGDHGVIGDDSGSVFVTSDGARTWTPLDGLVLRPSEWAVFARMDQNGVQAVVGDEGSVFVSGDGTAWEEVSSELGLSGRVTVFEWSSDGDHGVIGDSSGSVFVTSDGAGTWARLEGLRLQDFEWAVSASIGPDGVQAVVGDEGSVLVLRDGGGWENVALALSGRVRVSEWSADGDHGVIGGVDGSVYVTESAGASWRVLDVGSIVTMAAFSANGVQGVISAEDGGVFVTTDGGENWQMLDVELRLNESAVRAALGADGVRVLVGDEGSVLVRTNGGMWEDVSSEMSVGDGVTALGWSGSHGAIAGDDGSVYVTTDGGGTWGPDEGLSRDQMGRFEAAWVGAGGLRVVALHNGTAVLELKEERWSRRELDVSEIRSAQAFRVRTVGSIDNRTFLVGTGLGAVYVLRAYPGVSVEELPPESVRTAIQQLPRESGLRTDIDTFVSTYAPPPGQQRQAPERERFVDIDQTDWMRIALLITISYLVQLLIRQYQYDMRLSAFLDSRADAVVLAASFNGTKFEDLVGALGPDAYDFRPIKESAPSASVARALQRNRGGGN